MRRPSSDSAGGSPRKGRAGADLGFTYLKHLRIQYFTLVSENTVREYKSDLREVIEPQVNELIERAEKGLRVLERREASLKARVGYFLAAYNVRTRP